MKIILSKRLIKENHAVKTYNFDYIDQALIVLSETSAEVSIISFASIIGAPVGIAGAILTLFFPLTTRIIKKLLNVTRKKRKSMIKFLCLLKVNSIALKH